MTNKVFVSVMCLPDTQEEALKCFEALSRATIGLALEGIPSTISVSNQAPDEEGTDEPGR